MDFRLFTIRVLFFLLVIFFFLGIGRLHLNASYKAYFDPDYEVLIELEEIEKQYEPLDNIVILLSSKSGSILEQDKLKVLEGIVEQAWKIPHVKRVYSLLDPQLLDPQDDLDRFFSEDDSNRIQIPPEEKLLSHPRIVNLLLEKNKHSTAISIVFDLPGEDPAQESMSAADSAREIIQRELSADNYSDLEAQLSGTLMLNDNYINVVRHDLRLFIPTLLIIFFLALWFFFRDKKIAAMVLVCAFAAVIVAFGSAGWLGFELASIHTFAPVMIITISIAISVHLITTYFRQRKILDDNQLAMDVSVKHNRLAIRLTTLTTTIGFLTLMLSVSPPIRAIGVIVAMGTLAAYLINFYGLVRWIGLIPQGCSNYPSTLFKEEKIIKFIGWIIRSRKLILVSLLVTSVLALLMITQARIDDNVIEYFSKNNKFRVATEDISERLSGVMIVEYSLDTKKKNGVFSADYLNTTKQFKGWLLEQPSVKNVTSIVDLRANQFSYKIITQAEVDQVRELLGDQSPGELGISSEISEDYSATLIRVFLKNANNSTILDLDKKSRHWLKNNAIAYSVKGGTGPVMIFAQIGKQNISGMLQALLIALLLSLILIGFLARSLRVLIACAVCNLFPVLCVLSIWTLLDGRLSLGVTVVMGMIMGIIVDDTIHLVSKYHHFYHRSADSLEAITKTFIDVAPALVITTITLVLGLAVGLLSDFRPVAEMSQLSISIIFLALLIDLLVLPVLLVNQPSTINKNRANQVSPDG